MAAHCDPPDQPCVFIVDDDADLVAFLFSLLVDEGYSLVAASHGQQALDLLEQGLRPSVILIDLMLPQVSGIDILGHIRTDPELKAIPRIVITGSSERRTIVADAVFEKPFDPAALLRAVRGLTRSGDRKAAVGGGEERSSADERTHAGKPRGVR